MSKRTLQLYLDDIVGAIQQIESYTRGMTREAFVKDAKTMDAVVRNIEIIGEAATHIPNEWKVQHPAIPWKQIAGTRNKVIHEYFGVDETILWQTIQEDIPRLKKDLQQVIQSQ
jgi:uncharacterized protein with HEPN domain